MANVILVVHLLLALAMIGVVLLQRSEGGGLLGGGGGTATGRGATTPLGKVTWGLAAAFLCTSLALTILAASGGSDGSVLDRLGAPGSVEQDAGGTPSGDDLLPPPSSGGDGDGPLVPPPAE